MAPERAEQLQSLTSPAAPAAAAESRLNFAAPDAAPVSNRQCLPAPVAEALYRVWKPLNARQLL